LQLFECSGSNLAAGLRSNGAGLRSNGTGRAQNKSEDHGHCRDTFHLQRIAFQVRIDFSMRFYVSLWRRRLIKLHIPLPPPGGIMISRVCWLVLISSLLSSLR